MSVTIHEASAVVRYLNDLAAVEHMIHNPSSRDTLLANLKSLSRDAAEIILDDECPEGKLQEATEAVMGETNVISRMSAKAWIQGKPHKQEATPLRIEIMVNLAIGQAEPVKVVVDLEADWSYAEAEPDVKAGLTSIGHRFLEFHISLEI